MHQLIEESNDRQVPIRPRKLLPAKVGSMVVFLLVAVIAVAAVIQCIVLHNKNNTLLVQLNRASQTLPDTYHGSSGTDERPSNAEAGQMSQQESQSQDSAGNEMNLIAPLGSSAAAISDGNVTFIQARQEQLEHVVKMLGQALTSFVHNQSAALVLSPHIVLTIGASATFSCESNGHALSSCLWARTVNGRRQVILITDNGVISQLGGEAHRAEGITYDIGGLNDSKCAVKIESITEDSVGQWSCALISRDDHLFTGLVDIVDYDQHDPPIYFATLGGGTQAFWPQNGEKRTLVRSSETQIGIAFDTLANKIYWTSTSGIYGSGANGADVKFMLSASGYGYLRGLGLDWIGRNLYAVSSRGHVLACDLRFTREFRCATVLRGQGDLRGIAVDPIKGNMYFTLDGGAIVKAGMDGTNRTILVPGLRQPCGIVLDFKSSRLYWTDRLAKRIQSCDVDGGEVTTIAEFFNVPYGIAVGHQKLYWGFESWKRVQSCNMTGGDVRTLYTATVGITQMTVPDWHLPRNLENPCGEKICSGVCVLTPNSYKCL